MYRKHKLKGSFSYKLKEFKHILFVLKKQIDFSFSIAITYNCWLGIATC